jgi:hypothetical protein
VSDHHEFAEERKRKFGVEIKVKALGHALMLLVVVDVHMAEIGFHFRQWHL